jgi:predicted RNase H-like HicB family nuclease
MKDEDTPACYASSMSSLSATRRASYVASVPQIPACHTQARSLDEITERIREAIELCLEVEGTPEHTLEFVGIQRVTVAA